MRLYEITDGGVGYSYVRSYAWAETEEHALQLYRGRNPTRKVQEIIPIFPSASPAFCTLCDDGGFNMNHIETGL